MNVSATLNAFRLLRNPSLCLPHATIPTFNDLPLPLSTAFGNAEVDIRAVVLDKDNCFAVPKENVVYKPYTDTFNALRTHYPPPHLLIVSNSAGTSSSDPFGTASSSLASATNIPVLQHSTKKPGCGPQILQHFLTAPGSRVTSADQIAVVGDRLFTDVMLANLMGSWSLWVKDGVVQSRNPVGSEISTTCHRKIDCAHAVYILGEEVAGADDEIWAQGSAASLEALMLQHLDFRLG